MKKLLLQLLISSMFLAVLQAQRTALPATADILVQLRPETSTERFLHKITAQAQQEITLKKAVAPRFDFYLFSLEDPVNGEYVLETMRQMPEVVSAQWDTPVGFRDSIPNDPLWPGQWDMKRIGLPTVWEITKGGKTINNDEIVVAILDSGIDIDHEDLQGNIWENPGEIPGDFIDNDGNGFIDDVNGWNFRSDSPLLSVTSHGTSVSGIIGGKGNNGIGMSGINWNVKMMFFIINLPSEVVGAFNYILAQRELYNQTNGEKGAFVVVTNGSFGIDGVHCSEQPAWGSMYDPLGEVGILSVAATANEDWDVDEIGDIPTSCTSEYLIAVTSVDQDDERVSNAAYGPMSIDLAAPGEDNITTTTNDNYHETFGGTSSACPHVAGAVALLYSLPCTDIADLAIAQPQTAAQLIRDAILKNTESLSDLQGETVTGGMLDVDESMKYLHAYCIGSVAERNQGDFKEIYIEEKDLVRFFPNPASDILNITYGNKGFTGFSVRIFNAIGQEMEIQAPIQTQPFAEQTFQVDISDWAAGTYFVKVMDTNDDITWRFVKI